MTPEALTTQILSVLDAEAEERSAAIALLRAAVDAARPGLRAMGDVEIAGPGPREEPRGNSSTGRISGWAIVLTRKGELVRRAFGGVHSDFAEYHRPTHRDVPARVGDVPARDVEGAIRAILHAQQDVLRRRTIAAAEQRTAKLRAALSALEGA